MSTPFLIINRGDIIKHQTSSDQTLPRYTILFLFPVQSRNCANMNFSCLEEWRCMWGMKAIYIYIYHGTGICCQEYQQRLHHASSPKTPHLRRQWIFLPLAIELTPTKFNQLHQLSNNLNQ